MWGQRLKFLGRPKDENTAYSAHAYPPTAFTFNLERDLHYPGKAYALTWNKKSLETLARPYRRMM